MSRVGSQPIEIPSGVTVSFEGSTVTVKGPKGTITKILPDICGFEQKDGVLTVTRPSNSGPHRSMHGLTRTLIANMVIGVTEGFFKELNIVGVGFKAEAKGKELAMALGFSHPINYPIPEGIQIETPSPTQIKVSGIIKEQVGQVAAEIRRFRPPEPYKGKGILYAGEQIQRKAGKAAAGT